MFKRTSSLLLGVALIAPFALRLSAQDQPPAKKFAMQQIVFKGTRRYTDAQLLKAVGMQKGASYTQQDLQDFANKLSNTGMFSQVAYRFSPTSTEFDLVDNPRLLPLQFNNCVWMKDEEIISKLKESLPFFTGEVPEEGTLAEEVDKEFESLLGKAGVKAHAQFMPFADRTMNNQIAAMSYTIIDPEIDLTSIKFVGAAPKTVEGFDRALKRSLPKEYLRTLLAGLEEVQLKPVLDESGYIRATFGDASLKILTAPTDPITKVELTVPVQEGAQYRIASLSLKNTDPIAAEASKRLAAFKVGEIANMVAFRGELSKLGSAYLSKGYMNAKVRAAPNFDEAAHTVSFNIEIVPGDIYKLTKLDFQGLDGELMSKVMPLWTMHPGDVYDATYGPMFLKNSFPKLEALNGYSLAWTQKVNDDLKTVELLVVFRKPGSRLQ